MVDDDEKAAYIQAGKQFGVLCFILGLGMILYYLDTPESTFIDCLYFSTITATSIGFGDHSPQTPTGRIVSVFYILASVLMTGRVLGAIADLPLSLRAKQIKKRVMGQFGKELDSHELNTMIDEFGADGKVSRLQFVCAMLLKTKSIQQDDIDQAAAQFDRLDRDKSGSITLTDMLLQLEEEGQRDDIPEHEKIKPEMKKYENMQRAQMISKEIIAVQKAIEDDKAEMRRLRRARNKIKIKTAAKKASMMSKLMGGASAFGGIGKKGGLGALTAAAKGKKGGAKGESKGPDTMGDFASKALKPGSPAGAKEAKSKPGLKPSGKKVHPIS